VEMGSNPYFLTFVRGLLVIRQRRICPSIYADATT
jgi:hypothetical protein